MTAKGDNPRQQTGAHGAGLADGIDEVNDGHDLRVKAAAHGQLLIAVLDHGRQRRARGKPAGERGQRRGGEGERAVQPDAQKRQIAAGRHGKALLLGALDVQQPGVRLRRVGRAQPHDQLLLGENFGVVFAQQGANARVIAAVAHAGNPPEGRGRGDRALELKANAPVEGGQHLKMNGLLLVIH